MKDYYKYYINENKKEVIAVCRYASRTIRGKAKCALGDDFNVEFGKKLAKAKAELKVHKIKWQNASVKALEAEAQLLTVKRHREKMIKYLEDSTEQMETARYELVKIAMEGQMGNV